MPKQPKYQRILLKLSGEALKADAEGLYSYETVDAICAAVKKCLDDGIEVAIVVGAGNIWRGGRADRQMDRCTADQMGMLGTAINTLCLKDAFARIGVEARVMTAMDLGFAEHLDRDRAVRHLKKGRVVLFGGGTGAPFFSTDTAAVLRGKEIGADALLFAKNIDGIYTDDPRKNPDAKKLSKVSYTRILKDQLKAIDLTAAAFGNDYGLKILVFGLDDPENIYKIASGAAPGTVIEND